MHPIFRNNRWFAAYLVLWLALSGLLAALMRVPGVLAWREALTLAGPLCLFFAFVCLTPWYVCRQLPLVSSGGSRLALYHLGAAILATALWIGMARIIAYALVLGDRLDPEIPQLVAVGLLLYLLSVALHYMILAAWRHPARRQSTLAMRNCGRLKRRSIRTSCSTASTPLQR